VDEQAPGQARLKLKLVRNGTGQHYVAIHLKYRPSSPSRPITLLSSKLRMSLLSLLHLYR